jgi:hypothetical protein
VIARTLGAAALILLAPAAMACAGIQGTHECGGDLEVPTGCRYVVSPGARVYFVPAAAAAAEFSPQLYLPPGAAVVVCPTHTETEIENRLEQLNHE